MILMVRCVKNTNMLSILSQIIRGSPSLKDELAIWASRLMDRLRLVCSSWKCVFVMNLLQMNCFFRYCYLDWNIVLRYLLPWLKCSFWGILSKTEIEKAEVNDWGAQNFPGPRQSSPTSQSTQIISNHCHSDSEQRNCNRKYRFVTLQQIVANWNTLWHTMKHYKPIHPNHFKSLSLRETQTSPRHRYQIARAQEIQSPMMNENTIYETIEIQMIVVEWSKGPRHKSRWLCRGNTIFASEEIERRRHIEILDQVLHREIWLSLASQGLSMVM